jgi:hypothetical protein
MGGGFPGKLRERTFEKVIGGGFPVKLRKRTFKKVRIFSKYLS